MNREYGWIEFPKICQSCSTNIKKPYTENLYIVEKDGRYIEVCKNCYEKSKGSE